jgi:hypothetical protein
MSLLQYLKLQPVEPKADGSSDSPLDSYMPDEMITLDNYIDEQKLEEEWNWIVQDIEKDPEWFKFSDE